MVTSRRATLAIKAHSRGRLDYSKLDLNNRHHLLKEKWILDEIEREEVDKIYSVLHSQYMGLLNTRIESTQFKTIYNAADSIWKNMVKNSVPHIPIIDKSNVNMNKVTARSLYDKWAAVYGNYSNEQLRELINKEKNKRKQGIR